MSTVMSKDLKPIPVDVLRHVSTLILHAAVSPDTGFTVTHADTGAAVFSGQPRDVAEAFLEDVAEWPEWDHVDSLESAAGLRYRVMVSRLKAQNRRKP